LKGDHPRIKKKVFSSETTEPISTKLCWNDPWVVPFQNCVRQHRPVSMMATITKNRRTQFWKGTTQGSFQQSLVEIGSVVSEEKTFFLISSPLFSNLHNRSK
jgi:hypothetical protein